MRVKFGIAVGVLVSVAMPSALAGGNDKPNGLYGSGNIKTSNTINAQNLFSMGKKDITVNGANHFSMGPKDKTVNAQNIFSMSAKDKTVNATNHFSMDAKDKTVNGDNHFSMGPKDTTVNAPNVFAVDLRKEREEMKAEGAKVIQGKPKAK